MKPTSTSSGSSARLTRAERRSATARPDQAARLLERALDEWRGDALADLAFEPFAQAEVARLEELRVVALESRIDAELQLGRHAVAGSGSSA